MDNNTTETPTQEQTAESNAGTVNNFVVDDKFKSYWKSQGLTDDDFKDAATFNQATIDRYAKAIQKRESNPVQTAQPAQQQPAPMQQPVQSTVSPNLQLETTAYGQAFMSQYEAVDKDYIRSGKYLSEMAEAGMPAFTPDGQHINLQAASTFLKMKNDAASAQKQLSELRNAQTSSQPTVDPSTQGYTPDNGMAKQMDAQTAHAILAFNLEQMAQGKPLHAQTLEAQNFLNGVK